MTLAKICTIAPLWSNTIQLLQAMVTQSSVILIYIYIMWYVDIPIYSARTMYMLCGHKEHMQALF